MWAEIKRKCFHLTGLIYVVGLIYVPRSIYLTVIVSALVIEFIVEILRLNVPVIGRLADRLFGNMFRIEERTRFSGVFWMLAGVTTTILLLSSVTLAACALLYLILGDAVASLAGLRFGGPHWPGSKKRLSGSLACLMVCLLVGVLMLRPEFGWHGVILSAVIATLFERGVVPLNDNFTIPVAAAVAFLISYGLKPIG